MMRKASLNRSSSLDAEESGKGEFASDVDDPVQDPSFHRLPQIDSRSLYGRVSPLSCGVNATSRRCGMRRAWGGVSNLRWAALSRSRSHSSAQRRSSYGAHLPSSVRWPGRTESQRMRSSSTRWGAWRRKDSDSTSDSIR